MSNLLEFALLIFNTKVRLPLPFTCFEFAFVFTIIYPEDKLLLMCLLPKLNVYPSQYTFPKFSVVLDANE